MHFFNFFCIFLGGGRSANTKKQGRISLLNKKMKGNQMINTNEFKNYLIKKGYSEFTKSGRRSTVYDYDFRVKRVCRAEQLNTKDLADKIEALILDYSSNGIKWELGRLTHESVINALKALNRFIKEQTTAQKKSIFKALLAN